MAELRNGEMMKLEWRKDEQQPLPNAARRGLERGVSLQFRDSSFFAIASFRHFIFRFRHFAISPFPPSPCTSTSTPSPTV
jgi:hypothetical protein